jgi:hypothetical protein
MAVTAANVAQLTGAMTRDYVATSATVNGNAVAVDSNSQIVKAKADTAATSAAIGIQVAVPTAGATTSVAGERCTVVTLGPVGGFSGLTPGAIYYVDSNTAGEITATAPTGALVWAKSIGYAESATVLFVLPGVRPAISSAGA